MGREFRYGVRMLVRSPGFALTAILTLGLAIGANTAVFALVDAVLLKPLPYPQPERLAMLERIASRNGVRLAQTDLSHTGGVWETLRDGATSADVAVAGQRSARVSLAAGDRAISVAPQRVSEGFFRVLGVHPALGRGFTPDEDRAGGPAVVVLSDRVWRSVFSANPAVVGTIVLLKGEPHTVVGVMPASFKANVDADLWTPVRASRSGEGGGENYAIVLRLREGVSWSQAEADVKAAADAGLVRRATDDGLSWTHTLMPLQRGLASEVRQPLLILSGAVALVLLVACVNLAGLLLARAGQRTREIATRLAIGGNRAAVIRQLLIESVVLAACGGLTGLIVGAMALEGLKLLAADILTAWGAVSLDARVLAVTIGLTTITAVIFGLVPALHATRLDVQAALAESGTRSVAGGTRGWPRRLLVVGEVALGVALLVAAGLLIRTFVHLQTLAPGFDAENVVAASASLEDARYTKHEAVMRLFDESVARMRALPGVESAAVSLGLPYERILNMPIRVVGADGVPARDTLLSSMTYVTPGYFETLRMPARRGRVIEDRDTPASAPVMVVNESFVRRYLADRDPIGAYVRVANAERQIVGVVANVQQEGGFRDYGPIDALPIVYVPFAQFPAGSLRLYHGWFSTAWIVRTAPASPKRGGVDAREGGTGATTDQALSRAMAGVDPQLPFSAVRPIDAVKQKALSQQRLLMTLVSVLGGAALLLAAIGIHGLIASGVTERMRELGIRMALGATVGQAIRTVSLPGIGLTLAGLAIGCVLALGASSLVRSLLWGVQANDPLTFAGVSVTLLLVAIAASVLPALRVRRFDPAALLRE